MATTTTFDSGFERTHNTSVCPQEALPCHETLMGFASEMGEIVPTHIRRQEIYNQSFARGIAHRYENLYGSNSSVMIDGECVDGDTEIANWSIVGYSEEQIFFVITNEPYNARTVCEEVLHVDQGKDRFGVVEAVLQDGGASAGMFLGGKMPHTINPPGSWLSNPRDVWDNLNYDRHIAYAIGLVDPS